jgi:prepilin-type N-terminal cleavage/methylation domain-containing protein
MRSGERCARKALSQRGFTLVWLLAAVALLGVALAKIGPMWSQQMQREREAELLRIGALYARAIQSYRAASPGSAKATPQNLQALLADGRFVGTVRHLRKLYPDPLAVDQAWGLLRNPDGTLRGVYSTSELPPFRTEALQLPGLQPLAAARRYADWQFIPKNDDASNR